MTQRRNHHARCSVPPSNLFPRTASGEFEDWVRVRDRILASTETGDLRDAALLRAYVDVHVSIAAECRKRAKAIEMAEDDAAGPIHPPDITEARLESMIDEHAFDGADGRVAASCERAGEPDRMEPWVGFRYAAVNAQVDPSGFKAGVMAALEAHHRSLDPVERVCVEAKVYGPKGLKKAGER